MDAQKRGNYRHLIENHGLLPYLNFAIFKRASAFVNVQNRPSGVHLNIALVLRALSPRQNIGGIGQRSGGGNHALGLYRAVGV
jgi:hypothetical protein